VHKFEDGEDEVLESEDLTVGIDNLRTTQKQGCQMAYFKNHVSRFGQVLEGLVVEDVGILHGH
jgi:hypothetical protein